MGHFFDVNKLFTPLITLWVLSMFASYSYADEPDFLTPYVRAAYVYDSNLFRLADDQAAIAALGKADTAVSYSTLAAGVDMDLRLSRQTVRAHAEVNRTHFDDYSALDYAGRDASVTLEWLAAESLTGDLGIKETLTHASYTNVKQPVKNLVRTRKTFVDGVLGTDSAWQFKLGLERTTIDNEAAAQQIQDSDINLVKAGVEYESKGGSKVEFVTQRTDAKYPNRQLISTVAVNNGYRQWDNGIVASWIATGKTQLLGRLNHTRRSYQDVPQRDFTGLTGLLAANWAVTDITALRLSLHRDIGATDSDTASYAVKRGITLEANWRPTAKLAFVAQLSRDKIDYSGEPQVALNITPAREDRLTTLHAGLTYSILRNTTIGISVQKGRRESNEALSGYRYSQALLTIRSQF